MIGISAWEIQVRVGIPIYLQLSYLPIPTYVSVYIYQYYKYVDMFITCIYFMYSKYFMIGISFQGKLKISGTYRKISNVFIR